MVPTENSAQDEPDLAGQGREAGDDPGGPTRGYCRTMRVGLIMHCDQTTGRLDDALAQAGAEIERYLIHRNEPIPSDVDFDRVVILGGAMGAYEEGQHPWLADEKKWLRALVEGDVPVLGI
ncbi:MAG: hypothetical protein ACREA0_07325 [bacterium]